MIKWTGQLATGIEMVDSHNQRIIALISAFQTTIRKEGPDRGLVEVTLTALMEHSRAHFAEEEALMEFCGIDSRHVNAHIREHRSFSDDVARLAAHLDATTSQRVSEISEELVRFMTAWLMLHIVSMDQAMANQIRAIDAGSTPAAAFQGLQSAECAAHSSRVILHSVLDLWRDAFDQCRRLEARLATLTPCASPGVQLPRWPDAPAPALALANPLRGAAAPRDRCRPALSLVR
jgi:hemerythrin-like metal-binding protein